MTDDLDDQNADRVGRFRAGAAARGLPAAEVEAWIRATVPGVYFTDGGDGPPVVTTGGHPALPEDAPDPEHPLVVSVDCGLLPPGGAGFPLPRDGRLLFFADPDLGFRGRLGGAVRHVPAGTPVAERRVETAYGPFAARELRRMWHHLAGPDAETWAEARWEDPDDERYELAEELESAWTEAGGSWPVWSFALGGHPVVLHDDPLLVARDDDPEHAGDWVPLATWRCPREAESLDGGVVTWLIRRTDLTAGRFERVYGYVDM
ncbi:DUF1963 domain-containing protein [Streptomyces griseoviridis]|uniref:DUF1963 domain-containing protein n=1 Tax=Streptomyces griseoviridis TaxID=45398 RepID=A0ABT9LCG1_STRGD|nr:DUF1963 domain-containing protein [Streptomyces griseoviridis]MDP9681413.1 hypothetical protein [Streptomyces griseoviridis]GGS74762.1 hypothetical protein GCM10010240_04810 [Streptomyces griseoviridis]